MDNKYNYFNEYLFAYNVYSKFNVLKINDDARNDQNLLITINIAHEDFIKSKLRTKSEFESELARMNK